MAFLKKLKFWKKRKNTPTKVDACVSTEDPRACDAATVTMDPPVMCAAYTQTETMMDGGDSAAKEKFVHLHEHLLEDGKSHIDMKCEEVNQRQLPKMRDMRDLPQSTTSHERKAPTWEEYIDQKVALQLRVLRLQHEQREYQVNAVYSHKTMQYHLVLLSEDKPEDNYITLFGICEINSELSF